MDRTIYFVTNRKPNRKENPDDFGKTFADSVDDLRFGRAVVKEKNGDHSVSKVEVEPEAYLKNKKRAKLGSAAMFQKLLDSMKQGVDTIAFVHGYNVDFRQALCAGGAIHARYASADKPLNVVVFTWPSDGSMLPYLAYKSDRRDARTSGAALARVVLKLNKFLEKIRRGAECNARIHLMAHSMGNYVLRNGIQEMRGHVGDSLPRVFEQVFLMAADEDDDAFDHDYKLSLLPRIGSAINVYFNRGDTALVVSDRTKSNPTRLGTSGPRQPHTLPGNVSLIDCSEVVTGAVEHSYYIDDTETGIDVRQVLDGEPPDRIDERRYVHSQNRYVLAKRKKKKKNK